MEEMDLSTLRDLSPAFRASRMSPLLSIGDVLKFNIPVRNDVGGVFLITAPCLLAKAEIIQDIQFIELIPLCPDFSQHYFKIGEKGGPHCVDFDGPFELKQFDPAMAICIAAGSEDIQKPQIVGHVAEFSDQQANQ